MTRYNTLLLDQSAWDLVLDATGNIAVGAPPYSLAQDVASACRLFLGELWYSSEKGIPYFEDVLGHAPPLALIAGHLERAAMSVPGVKSAQCIINDYRGGREASGVILFIDETGIQNGVSI